MTDFLPNADLRSRLAAHPIHDLPRVPGAFMFDRWHRDRFALAGYRTEAIKFVRAFRNGGNPARMIVYGRPRSGTTVLGSLLGQIDGVHDAGERLHNGVFSPIGILEKSARTCGARAFIAKLLTYQLLEVQAIRDPLQFFERLVDLGYEIVHLRRETYPQALSLCKARVSGIYFDQDGTLSAGAPRELQVDPVAFEAQIRRSAAMLDYEDMLMSGVPHHVVQYEKDLQDPDRHQALIDRLCDVLRLPTQPVKARMRRTGGKSGTLRVVNENELDAHLRAVGLATEIRS
ncbi:hypothetical protein [uncultured Jannaschia sp.]|uniref:hypothetical protein n=1 Tax=uncultured Jannaschia sp. TaxID=293347 RepID=UPI002624D6AA|nr:hypothetical protein [uncultured Jannaschia sp.]